MLEFVIVREKKMLNSSNMQIDFDRVFRTKIAIVLSTDDSPIFQLRKVHHVMQIKSMGHFTQIADKNLA